MNQKAWQKLTSSVERDFYKLLNNSNFGIDYQNNFDNYILESLYDEIRGGCMGLSLLPLQHPEMAHINF